VNSKQKGKRGELELSAYLREHGFTAARRGVQYQGGPESKDVVGVPGLHVECKYMASLLLYPALEQATKDAGAGDVPVVMFRQVDGKKRLDRDWVAVLRAEDFLSLWRELQAFR
jgi:hypothetical protein